jgi:tetratricopeptide (TPR) repeat protein
LKSSKLIVATILIATIGLVAAPILRKGISVELAHWYLAAGANAVELGTGDATKEIEQARRWYSDLDQLRDYWLVRIKQAKAISPLAMLELMEDVPEEERADLAIEVANELISSHDFGAAANAYRLAFGNGVLNNEEYWQLQVMAAYQTSAPAAVQVLREAVQHNPRFVDLALRYSLALASKLEFDSALEALKLAVDVNSKDPTVLNQLAYYRALARVELEQALQDINQALESDENEPALRDTRGWVLYQLGRPEEALKDAQFAVEAMERTSMLGILERSLGEFTTSPDYSNLLPEANLAVDPLEENPKQQQTRRTRKGTVPKSTHATKGSAATDGYLNMSAANPVLWNLAVLRYHRAMILQKLGREDEAKQDWDWLKKHNFPPDERLH